MDELGNEMNYLASIRISYHEADSFVKELIALPKNATKAQEKNTKKLREKKIKGYLTFVKDVNL